MRDALRTAKKFFSALLEESPQDPMGLLKKIQKHVATVSSKRWLADQEEKKKGESRIAPGRGLRR